MKANVSNALAATAAVERHLVSVQALLNRTRHCNRHGVFMDPTGVLTNIAAASHDLRAAAEAIASAADEWPTPADYREV